MAGNAIIKALIVLVIGFFEDHDKRLIAADASAVIRGVYTKGE